jgi:ankyrin repeat protein
MSRQLPASPNLEHLKKQAKELLEDFRQNKPEARARFREEINLTSTDAHLADAQHVIARSYGFASWPKLKEHVEWFTLSPQEQLSAAVRASDAQRVKRVLEEHSELAAQLNEPMLNYGGLPALLAAVQRNDIKTIDVLLRAGADINARGKSWAGGRGILDECAPGLAGFVIERGAIVDVHSAARLGMVAKVRELVETDPAAVNARGEAGQTPLHFASTIAIAEVLLDYGADIDARDLLHESTPAQHMIRVIQARHYPHDRQPIARYLVARGCQTDILMAVGLGDFDLVRRHVEADPECVRIRVSETYFPRKDPRGGGTYYIPALGRNRTPHQVARDFGHEEIFQFLIEHSPEDVKLSQACQLGDENLFRSMLARRPNMLRNLTDEQRRQVADAAQNNNTSAVRLMLAAGWPVDARGEYAMTPLQWASWHGNSAMVGEILRYRPRLELSCDHGITALGSALHGSMNGWHRDTGDYVATLEALLEAGAKAPKITDDLEASDRVRDLLRRHAESRSAQSANRK